MYSEKKERKESSVSLGGIEPPAPRNDSITLHYFGVILLLIDKDDVIMIE
jgi:hypothetical protein